jgi:hypothetical protein
MQQWPDASRMQQVAEQRAREQQQAAERQRYLPDDSDSTTDCPPGSPESGPLGMSTDGAHVSFTSSPPSLPLPEAAQGL